MIDLLLYENVNLCRSENLIVTSNFLSTTNKTLQRTKSTFQCSQYYGFAFN